MNGLPAGWRATTLGQVGSWGSGGTPQAGNPAFYWGTIPWAVIGDLNDGVVTDTASTITPAGLAHSSAKLVPAGAILVAMYGSIGKLGIAGREMATNQAIAFVVPNQDVLPRYLFFYLQSQKRALDSAGKGAAQRNISQTILKSWPITYPAVHEQRRIVAILEEHLSSLDAAVGNLRRAQLRANSLLAQHLSATRRGPAVPLPEVAEIQGGIQKQQKRAPRDNSYPFLRVANVTAGGLDLSEVHKVELFDGEIDRLRLQAGDLLVVEGNGSPSQIGRAALWDGSIEDCVHQNHLIRVRADRSKLLPGYLEAVWNSPENRKVLTDVSSSSSGLHTLSVSKLRRILIPLPSLAEQEHASNELAEARETHRRLTHALVQAERRSTRLRQALLAAAFSGRLTGRSSDSELIEELADQEAS